MFSGGHVIVAVANLDTAARFYTEQLGLKLTHRFGNRWVTVDAGLSYWGTEEGGAGLVLGLQPHTSDNPAPGTRGAVGFGLETGDSLESLVTQCSARGVRFTSDIITFEGGKSIALNDAEGNETYLWEQTEEAIAEQERGGSDAETHAVSPSISGGHAIVFVSNMDRAVHYYSEVLGFPLTYRYEDKIAFVEAGRRLVIALHPTSPKYAPPGTRGAIRIALQVDEPIDRVISRLAARGVRVARAERGPGHIASRNATAKGDARASTVIEDFDGNPIEIVEEGPVGRTDNQEAVLAQSSR